MIILKDSVRISSIIERLDNITHLKVNAVPKLNYPSFQSQKLNIAIGAGNTVGTKTSHGRYF